MTGLIATVAGLSYDLNDGAEIRLLKRLFTPEEAKLAIHLIGRMSR